MKLTYKKGIGIAILAFMVVSVGFVGVPMWFTNVQPTLNVLSVLEDPSALELYSMSITEKENETITWKIELKVRNPGGDTLLFPALSFDVNFLGGKLGNGWISHAITIPGNAERMVPAYIRMDKSTRLDLMINGLLQGSAMNLELDGEALIMLDVLENQIPIASLAYPFVLGMPLSEGDNPSPPTLYWVNRSSVSSNSKVDINATAKDSGGGLKTAILSYSNNSGVTWNNISMSGINATNYIESNWMNISLNASIPAGINIAGNTIYYKIYLFDDFDNLKISETYQYTVPIGAPLPESQIEISGISAASDFMSNFLDYLAQSGVDLNYLLSRLMTEIGQDPVLENVRDLFFMSGFSFDQGYNFLFQFLESNLTHAFSILSDARLSIYSFLDALTVDMSSFLDELLYQIALPTTGNLTVLAGSMTAEQNSTLNQTLVSVFGPNCTLLNNFLSSTFLDPISQPICESDLIPLATTPILQGFLSLLQQGNITNGGLAGVLQAWNHYNGSYNELVTSMGTQITSTPAGISGGTFQLYQAVIFGVLIYFGLMLVSIAAIKGKPKEVSRDKKKLTKQVDSWFKKSTVRR